MLNFQLFRFYQVTNVISYLKLLIMQRGRTGRRWRTFSPSEAEAGGSSDPPYHLRCFLIR